MGKKHVQIKVLFMDVDGTMTDGKIYMSEVGEMMKAFDIKDGLAIHDILPQKGIRPIIITGRKSKILELRCRELGITDLYQGVRDKVKKAEEILEELHISWNECAYVGDDINDLECMNKVEIKGCPSDAVEEIRKICDFISNKAGGNGAVREFIEWL